MILKNKWQNKNPSEALFLSFRQSKILFSGTILAFISDFLKEF